LVHPGVTLPGHLKREQIIDIFSGKAKNWKELGGNDLPIQLVVDTSKKTRLGFFENTIMGGKKFAKTLIEATGTEDTIAKIAATPGSVSYAPRNEYNLSKAASTVKVIKNDPPMGRPVTLITKGKPTEEVMKLVNFLMGEGKSLIEK
jgi:phosphate transport system substrate-binding protein